MLRTDWRPTKWLQRNSYHIPIYVCPLMLVSHDTGCNWSNFVLQIKWNWHFSYSIWPNLGLVLQKFICTIYSRWDYSGTLLKKYKIHSVSLLHIKRWSMKNVLRVRQNGHIVLQCSNYVCSLQNWMLDNDLPHSYATGNFRSKFRAVIVSMLIDVKPSVSGGRV